MKDCKAGQPGCNKTCSDLEDYYDDLGCKDICCDQCECGKDDKCTGQCKDQCEEEYKRSKMLMNQKKKKRKTRKDEENCQWNVIDHQVCAGGEYGKDSCEVMN